VLTKNSKPAIQFDQKFLQSGALASSLSGKNLAAFSVLALNNAGAFFGRIASLTSAALTDDASAGNCCVLIRNQTFAQIIAYNTAERSVQNVSYGAYNQLDSVFDGTNHIMYLNGAGAAQVASADTFSSTRLLMGDNNGGNRADFNVGEFILINAAVTSTRATIEASQKAYFGTP
jgi:hypothetical protein